MNRRTGIVLIAATFAVAVGSASGGLASAQPAFPRPGVSAAGDTGTKYTYVRDTGTVARVATNADTATVTITAADRSWCFTGLVVGTGDDIIAKEDNPYQVQPIDIPGPDLVNSVGPAAVPFVSFPVTAKEQSPATLTATLPAGEYTALSYCYNYDAEGNYIPNTTYYLDEFTLPSVTTPPSNPTRFGSS